MSLANPKPLLLITDDELLNILLLERVFSNDYRVLTAANGPAALEIIAREPVDCALIDIMMPGLTGLQVLEKIRETPETADLPVILVSALSDRQDVVRGLKMGANDYVTKPFELEVLSARVQTQLKLKQLQDQRKQVIEELRSAQEMKDRLLRIASHDLKSPLANISMIKYLLRETVADNSQAQELLDILDTTTDHMLNVVRDFLETAAIQSGEVDLQLTHMPLDEVVLEVCDQYQLITERKNISLELGELNGYIVGDRARISQVLDNLVSNALKYSPPGSTVYIWTETRGSFVRVCVADQGPGIAPEERPRLFTEFGRTSNRPTGGESSTGLGLWIVKHLVTLHGGQVGVDSAPGGGSIFWIELPLAEDSFQTHEMALSS